MIDITTNKHNVAFPSRVQSAYGGGHIYDIKLTQDHDNGEFVGLGKYISLGTYEEGDCPTDVTGKVVEVASNGNYYVEIDSEPKTELVFIHQPVVSPYSEKSLQREDNWFNEKGATVKGYSIHAHDIVEEASKGFDGEPKVGATVTVSAGKLKVAAEAGA